MEDLGLSPAMLFELDHIITEATKRWAESEKNRNQSIGESRAEQELAFREFLTTVKTEKLGKSEKFLWITVNPKKGIDLATFMLAIKKAYSKKWMDRWAYIFENTANDHIHSHGLVRTTYEFSRAKKEIGNSIKHLCDITNPHCYKVVAVSEEVAQEKMLYMLGKKKLAKLADVELTRKWREENNISEIYTSEVAPILLATSGKGIEKGTFEDNVPEPELPPI